MEELHKFMDVLRVNNLLLFRIEGFCQEIFFWEFENNGKNIKNETESGLQLHEVAKIFLLKLWIFAYRQKFCIRKKWLCCVWVM